MRSYKYLFLLCIILVCLTGFYGNGKLKAQAELSTAPEIVALIEQADSLIIYNRPDSASILADRGLEKARNAFGEKDTLFASALNTRGYIHLWVHNYQHAESCFNQALAIQEELLVTGHPDIGRTYRLIGYLYWIMARYNEAEDMTRRSLSIYDKAGMNNYAGVADAWFVLCLILSNKGDYKAGEEAFFHAKAIYENSYCENHPRMALVWAARAYFENDLKRTLSLYKKAIEILDESCGPGHPWTAIPYYNTAAINFYKGNYAEAESFFNEVIKTAESSFTSNSSLIGGTYQWLGKIYSSRGEYANAEHYFKKALSIFESRYGNNDISMVDLADLYGSTGEYDKAAAHYKRDWQKRYNYIQYAFTATSEMQKIRYLRTYPIVDESHLSLCFIYDDPGLKQSALDMVFKSKAIILDALAAEKEVAYCSNDEKIAGKVQQYAEICGKIAALSLAAGRGTEPAGLAYHLNNLYEIKDSLEQELSNDCYEFEEDISARKYGVSDIARLIPDDAVLWEYFKYSPYDFNKIGTAQEKFGPRRYMAFTLDNLGQINVIDIGEVKMIDSLISACRDLIYDSHDDIYSGDEHSAEQKLGDVTSKLYNYLFQPLFNLNSKKTRIIVSPEGLINLLPFEILACPDGKHVLEKFLLSYLSSGRDLQRLKKPHNKSNWALILANPDFYLPTEVAAQNRLDLINDTQYVDYIFMPFRGASGCLDRLFTPLYHTEKEMELVAEKLENMINLDVKAYSGHNALEEVIKGMSVAPKVLHISTHGFFCADEENISENPLLRSGLAFVGANSIMNEISEQSPAGEDGILTALEVSSINLLGTELVVLSACETGVGEIQRSEGVYGLRRAFQLAGARTILSSMWAVPDKQTRDLMTAFYENWLSGQSKAEALRNSALTIIEERRKAKGSAHPLFWGGFILIGDPD